MRTSTLRTLEAAGFSSAQADALTDAMDARLHTGESGVATNGELHRAVDGLRAEIYRALWVQGVGIVAVVGVLLAVAKAF